ncbi:MAG TPA: SIS domain-containing protein [Saprospiraceae bacterium]|nr:SIS domain-containing protein [Saprospiraceae bacterium]
MNSNQNEFFIEIINENIALKKAMAEDSQLFGFIHRVIDECVSVFRKGGKVIWCGNGGSAADAQHLAAELSGKFYFKRSALYSIALHSNSSFLTAVSNDFGFEYAYARNIESMGKEGDVLICLSTSGNSLNILNAARTAQKMKLMVFGLTGMHGDTMSEVCHHTYLIPSINVARIQESHMLIGHIICQKIEQLLFE